MKQAARYFVVTALTGAASVFSSCSGGGGGGGGMYVESCTLGCTNGKGGAQVSCGIINTFQNQDIAIVFSEPVSLASLLANNAFQVVDTVTGGVPQGTRLVDQNNPRRAIFRPKLSFDAQGNPSYGFQNGSTYLVRIPGTKQNDPGPYVESNGGQPNTSRLLCTITTDQGLIDPVPGSPLVSIFVQVQGQTQPVNLDTNPNVNNVLTNSPVTIVFNDLMNIGTVVQPSTGQAPFISVKVDPDGNLSTTADQVPVGGTYTFSINQATLQTTAIFTPTGGFPSAGSSPTPRKIVVDVPSAVKDLAGNAVANAGKRTFVPQIINFTSVMLPDGGEQFTTSANMDILRSGADWGETTSGRLLPGAGGGSGRYGDLSLPVGTTHNFYTSPQKATVRLHFTKNIKPALDQAQFMINNGLLVSIKAAVGNPNAEIQAEKFLSDMISECVRYFENNPSSDPQIAQCDFSMEDTLESPTPNATGYDTLVITYNTPGTGPNENFIVAVYTSQTVIDIIGEAPMPIGVIHPDDTNWPPGNTPYYRTTMKGGVSNGLGDFNSQNQLPAGSLLTRFNKRDFITNFALSAVIADPDNLIPDPVISNGVLEFATVTMGQNTNFNAIGSNPLRLFTRGAYMMADSAKIDASGANAPNHYSDSPLGEKGAVGGPAGGRGGRGADRPDDSASPSLLSLANCTNGTSCGNLTNCATMSATEVTPKSGITNAGAVINGSSGEGVGGTLGFGGNTNLGFGRGGVHWPNNLPTGTALGQVGGLDTSAATCFSQQLGGSGSGGAFAMDGELGISISTAATGQLGTLNVPSPTAGGDSTAVGLEPSANPGPKRALTPSLGYLRGGSGGGGGGTHPFDTQMLASGGNCFGVSSTIGTYRTHSGAAGGGGGGAVQLVAGRIAQIDGVIDASGGNGGGAIANNATPCHGRVAMPGGGGSGGGILLQSRTVDLAPLPNRLIVAGGLGGSGPAVGGPGVSSGGNGGAGLVRIEDNTGLDPVTAAVTVSPTDPNDITSSKWLSVAAWGPQSSAGEAYSGAESCWIRPVGNFFSLTFNDDAPNTPGWDMDVWLDQGAAGINKVSFRNSAAFGGNSPEQHWGSLIDDGTLVPPQTGAPIIVRFQGAKSQQAIADLCNVDVSANSLEVVHGSLSPWVMHPSELNQMNPPPDLLRFQIVFDRSHAEFNLIHGVTNVRVFATPD